MSKRSYAATVLALVIAGTVVIVWQRDMTPRGTVGTLYAAAAKPAKQPSSAAKQSPAEIAIRASAARRRYVFVTFYKKQDTSSTKMLAAIRSARGKLSNRANFVSVDVGSAANQALVKRYDVDRAPLPLTLVLAPNGALTAAFPREIETSDFSDVFVSEGLADVLKVVQSGKLAAVCLQNGKTKFNKESLAAAEGLRADSRLSGRVGIVKIDPSDRAELKFLQQCKVNNGSADSQIVLIVPPGRVLGAFDGNTTKDKLMAGLQAALASCGSGCGPSGCGP